MCPGGGAREASHVVGRMTWARQAIMCWAGLGLCWGTWWLLLAGLGGSGLGRDSGAEQTSHTMLSVARFRSGSWEARGSNKHIIVRSCARVPFYGGCGGLGDACLGLG